MIKATDIRKSYGELEVLKGVSLEISEGEIVSIVGASGAGNLHYCTLSERWTRPILELLRLKELKLEN